MNRFFFFILFFPLCVHAQSFVSTGGPIIWSLSSYTLSLGNPTVTPSSVHPGNFVVTFPVSEDLHAGWQDYSYILHTTGGSSLSSTFQVNYPATSFVLEFGPDFNGLSNIVSTSGGVGTITVTPGATLPQTCTLSNATVPPVNGATITGTATGAQSGNSYNIAVVGGPLSVSINSTTGAYSVTATGHAFGQYKVWISAGSGYAQSPDVIVGGIPASSYKFKYTIPANNGAFPITYTLKQGTTVVGTVVMNPGDAAIIGTVDLGANAGTVTMTSSITGAILDGLNLISSPGTVTVLPQTQTFTPQPTDTPTPQPVTASPVSTPTTTSPTPASSGVVWSAPTTTAAGGDGLTNQVYREGVTKVLDKLNSGKDYNASTDLATAQTLAANAPSYTGPSLSGDSSGSVTNAAVNPTTINSWQITPGHTITVTMDPTGSAWASASSLLSACRPLILWAAVIGCVWSCGGIVSGYVQSLPQVQAADSNVGIENLVPGVPQGKVWTAAAIITGIIVATLALIIVALDHFLNVYGFGIGSLFSAVSLTSLGGGLAILDRFIPITALCAIALFRGGFPYLVAPIYIGAAASLKFIKA